MSLERNDVAGAVAYLETKLDSGTWKPEDSQMMLMLQDDDGEQLTAALRAVWARRAAEGKAIPGALNDEAVDRGPR